MVEIQIYMWIRPFLKQEKSHWNLVATLDNGISSQYLWEPYGCPWLTAGLERGDSALQPVSHLKQSSLRDLFLFRYSCFISRRKCHLEHSELPMPFSVKNSTRTRTFCTCSRNQIGTRRNSCFIKRTLDDRDEGLTLRK